MTIGHQARRGSLAAVAALFAVAIAFPQDSVGSGGGGAPFSGQVQGGGGAQNPINGANVKLFVTGATDYGQGATSLASTASDGHGAFNIGSYTCPSNRPGAQTYIVATGGNAGAGTNNAIGLMALAGPYNSLGSATFVTINELTTVAAEWALAQFTDPATGQVIGASSTNAAGLDNAVHTAMSDLVKSVGTNATDPGIPAGFLPTALNKI